MANLQMMVAIAVQCVHKTPYLQGTAALLLSRLALDNSYILNFYLACTGLVLSDIHDYEAYCMCELTRSFIDLGYRRRQVRPLALSL